MNPPPPESKLRALRDYLTAGFALIPLCSPTEPHSHRGKPCPIKNMGKSPIKNEWTDTPPGTYGVADLASINYGVVLSSTDVVVDVDPRNFKKGDKPLTRLSAAVGGLPQTYYARTGSGGLHLHFKKPAGFHIVGKLKEYPGIDFKSAGGQVVGPGSLHAISKKYYEVGGGSPLKIADAPQALLDLIAQKIKDWEGETGLSSYQDDPQTRGRFSGFLTDLAEPSIEGQGGDANAFRVACYGRDLGLPPSVTLELMLENWNEKCQPPWGFEELKEKVRHAYKYASGPLGSASVIKEFSPLPIPSSADPLSDSFVPPPAAVTPHDSTIFKDSAVVSSAGVLATMEKDAELPWVHNNQGGLVVCWRNLLNIVRSPSHGVFNVFGYNEFTGRIEFRNAAPWHRDGVIPRYPSVGDKDLKMLKGFLAVRHNFEAPIQGIEEAVTIAADNNRFHPVRDFLKGLKWDGKRRIDTWLQEHLDVEDNAYTRAVARKVLVAAVTRVLQPGVKFDHVLVLEGRQDIGKSTVCSILGGEWSADFPVDPHDKDTVQLLQGVWVAELAEMEVVKRAEREALKAFLTRRVDQARLAYGRTISWFPRQSIFIATKNPEADGAYLGDEENRRWWPVTCMPNGGQVDFARFKEATPQLWAEAYAVATGTADRAEEPLFMETRALKDKAREVVALRHAEHPWTERIMGWLSDFKPAKDFISIREVFCDGLGGIDKQLDRRSSLAIASVLRAHGWSPTVKRIGERTVRGFMAPGASTTPPAHSNGTAHVNGTAHQNGTMTEEQKAILGDLL